MVSADTPASIKGDDADQGSVHSWNPNDTNASAPGTSSQVCDLLLACDMHDRLYGEGNE
jgi:hypothetical protein